MEGNPTQFKKSSCVEIPSLPALCHCYTLAALLSMSLNPFVPFMLS